LATANVNIYFNPKDCRTVAKGESAGKREFGIGLNNRKVDAGGVDQFFFLTPWV
jgi:hypothetical protein